MKTPLMIELTFKIKITLKPNGGILDVQKFKLYFG